MPLRRDTAGLFITPKAFRRHVHLVRRWGYRFVTFGELAKAAAQRQAEGLAALTFDDGLADNLHTLVPLLDELQAVATVFVVPRWNGTPHPDAPWACALTHDEVRKLAAAGVEIGSHSFEHRDLSTCSYEEALDDLTRSRQALEELLERPVTVAAYPYGRTTPDAGRACRDAGFEAACRISGEGSWDDPWNLPRQDMNNGAGVIGLWLKRQDRYEAVVQTLPGRALRSAARRVKARFR